MVEDAKEDEELRFCFNIDVTEDEFYKNNEVNICGSVRSLRSHSRRWLPLQTVSAAIDITLTKYTDFRM